MIDNAAQQLSLKDCYDMSLKLGDKIDGCWRQFYIVTFGIAAWSFSTSAGLLGIKPIILILFAAFIFTVHSATMMLKLYPVFNLLLKETKARVCSKHFLLENSEANFSKAANAIDYEKAKIYVIGTHALCYIAEAYLFLSKA